MSVHAFSNTAYAGWPVQQPVAAYGACEFSAASEAIDELAASPDSRNQTMASTTIKEA